MITLYIVSSFLTGIPTELMNVSMFASALARLLMFVLLESVE